MAGPGELKATYGELKTLLERISDITKDTSIKVASAFKYPPNVFVKSFMCVPTLKTHLCGKWCSIWSKIYTLSTHIKYKAIIVTTKYIKVLNFHLHFILQ